MKTSKTLRIRITSVILFIISFLILNGILHIMIANHMKEEQLKAEYTAQSTVARIESQLNGYLEKSSILKQIIEADYTIDDEAFPVLAGFIRDNSDVIETIELARDGIVSRVYPYEGNENAYGLNLLEHPERIKYATLAKESGQYTIAGPFELVQGGMGALLIDPIYKDGISDDEHFWGFSVLVINWDSFIKSLELNQLENSAYHYQIWKNDLTTSKQIYIAHCDETDFKGALEVICDVPNDEWFFDIVPINGWYSKIQLAFAGLFCLCIAILLAITYGLSAMQRYKQAIYTDKIQQIADEAKAANKAKTSFLSRMSHDIRTPLNGIIGLLHIDETHPDDTELITSNREKMLVAANHLLSLINDVLQMSKLESMDFVLSKEVINLNELASDVLTIVEQRAADAGVTLEYDAGPDRVPYPYVYGSPVHLRQIFLNIYGNSIKYNRVGGKVTSKVYNLGITDNIATYKWVISDTGIGMSQKFLEHIFEPFAQEHTDARSIYNGTGLGMAIVKSLIDKMNGTIEITSVEDEGSIFTITIPFEIAAKPEPKADTSTDGDKPDISGFNLLLAEDNDLNAEIAEMLLSDQGANITIVKDGRQAIDAFINNPPGTYDAILMDIMMPVIDGIHATKSIRSLDRPDAKTIPIIAMTANAFNEDADRCIAAGMNAHLAKPLQMDKVISTIAKYCSHQP